MNKEQFIKKVSQNREKANKEIKFYCKAVNEELIIELLPLEEALDILYSMNDNENPQEQIKMFKELIYSHCPLMRIKELQKEEYIEPFDVVEDVFCKNYTEIILFGQKILGLYGLNEGQSLIDWKNDVKN